MNAFVYGLVVALHILICLILVAVVLLQTGKGADIGAAFGGSSQTVFGSRGPTTFFHYLTTCSAILFIFTSLFLSCTPGPKGGGSSVIGDATPSPTPAAVSGTAGGMAPMTAGTSR
jgi:preprotein translocase subunit SecG